MPSLRKFGLSFCDLPTMLENVSYFLRFTTLNIDERRKNGKRTIFPMTSSVSFSNSIQMNAARSRKKDNVLKSDPSVNIIQVLYIASSSQILSKYLSQIFQSSSTFSLWWYPVPTSTCTSSQCRGLSSGDVTKPATCWQPSLSYL